MSYPALPLQKAVRDALIAQPVGCKVYDAVPDNAPMPFIHIGDDQIIADNEFGQMFDCSVNVHIYARDKDNPGKVKLKTLAALVYTALNVQLTVPGFECMTPFPFEDDFYRSEADLKTEHCIMTFRYSLQVR